ncbi:unnamed protein product (macronuclear) [Paramecium tetraurelia]|uniref:t-SNARE coiled-coil homology domain-containing protein n=1 Tax=Paramecium tetraurelia TaxID=5888 RepID=A0BU38_PARTE|nr:uncharacterized protein GSPATT00032287001 [Paramecium tetraurelia]CAK62055.1 unnamed protein product [Paramecium tetraurelia]|eukprot:XP_001429453.1 hypothetical protein (macronuclear) [Paramecium tetraurelia strain d4-2]
MLNFLSSSFISIEQHLNYWNFLRSEAQPLRIIHFAIIFTRNFLIQYYQYIIILFKTISSEDPTNKELNNFVQTLLKQMSERFEEMQGTIVSRIDDMGKRIDDIEKSVTELMNDLGFSDEENEKQRRIKIFIKYIFIFIEVIPSISS